MNKLVIEEKDRKILVEALVYMLRRAYTNEEIMDSCDQDQSRYAPILAKKMEKLQILKKLISIFHK